MALFVEEENNRFRVEWQGNSEASEEYSTDWLPDTPSNRKAILVFLRLLRDERGKRVFTFQDLSAIVGSQKRQASSGHVERFRECGCDFLKFLTRKRKVDSEVVEAVLGELLSEPLAEIKELQERVNTRLGRNDLTPANIQVALEQISYHQIRGAIRKQIAKGKAHYKEEYLLEEMMSTMSCGANASASVGSTVIPRTTNAIERFFRAFNRFYKVRCGFFTVISARRELIFFLLMYVFIQQPGSGKAPIESIMPEARRMPLYRIVFIQFSWNGASSISQRHHQSLDPIHQTRIALLQYVPQLDLP